MVSLPMHERYRRILSLTEPYVLTYPENLERYDLSPWGLTIPESNRFSPTTMALAPFFDLLQRLDQLSFGPVGMPMDKWVFYDCGEMPGGVVGLGIRADRFPTEARSPFELDTRFRDYRGLVPISMYIAIPFPVQGRWFGHNLSSVSQLLPSLELTGLGLLTKAFALDLFRITEMIGATQWDSKSIHIHVQLSDLELLTTYTPAHSFPKTFTYRARYSRETRQRALSGIPRSAPATVDEWIHPEDEAAMISLQQELESGRSRLIIEGRPVDGRVPVRRVAHA